MCNMHVSKCLNVAVCSLPFSMLALYVSKLDLWICLSQHMCVLSLSFSHSEMHIGAHTKSIRPDLLSLTVQTVIHMTEGGWQCALSFGKCRSHTSPYVLWTNWRPPYTHHTSRYTHTHSELCAGRDALQHKHIIHVFAPLPLVTYSTHSRNARGHISAVSLKTLMLCANSTAVCSSARVCSFPFAPCTMTHVLYACNSQMLSRSLARTKIFVIVCDDGPLL